MHHSPQPTFNINMQNIYLFYIDIAKMIESSSNISVLSIRQWDKSALNKGIVKILKVTGENFDSFADISA